MEQYKNLFPDRFKSVDEDMVNNSVFEISREDLAELRLSSGKKDRVRRAVGSIFKLFFQLQNILFGVYLELQGVDRVSLIAPTLDIAPVDVSERE